MRRLFRRVSSGAGRVWCRSMHPAPMWPIHNHYVCPQCQRQWPVRWLEQRETLEAPPVEALRRSATPPQRVAAMTR